MVQQVFLNLDRAGHSIGNRRKLDDPAIAHPFDNIALVIAHHGIEEFIAQAAQHCERARLILAHHAGIFDHVGG